MLSSLRPRVRDAEVVVPSALFVLAGIAMAASLGWPPSTALLPRAVGIPLMVLCLVQVVVAVSRGGERSRRGMDMTIGAGVPRSLVRRRALVFVLALLSFLLIIWALGFQIAGVLAVAGYAKLIGRESWRMSVALGVGAGLVVFALRELLRVPLPQGALFM